MNTIGSVSVAVEDGPFVSVEGWTPGSGAIEVPEDSLGLEEVRHSRAVSLGRQVHHLFPDIMAALETIDEGTNYGLVHDRINRGGVSRGADRSASEGILDEEVMPCSAQSRVM